jgi:hypothetical protein
VASKQACVGLGLGVPHQSAYTTRPQRSRGFGIGVEKCHGGHSPASLVLGYLPLSSGFLCPFVRNSLCDGDVLGPRRVLPSPRGAGML